MDRGGDIRETSPVSKGSYPTTILLEKFKVQKHAPTTSISSQDVLPVGLTLVAICPILESTALPDDDAMLVGFWELHTGKLHMSMLQWDCQFVSGRV